MPNVEIISIREINLAEMILNKVDGSLRAAIDLLVREGWDVQTAKRAIALAALPRVVYTPVGVTKG